MSKASVVDSRHVAATVEGSMWNATTAFIDTGTVFDEGGEKFNSFLKHCGYY